MPNVRHNWSVICWKAITNLMPVRIWLTIPAWLAEETCFIPDIAPEDACALGEEYGQNAVVVGGSDAVAHLLWIEPTAQ